MVFEIFKIRVADSHGVGKVVLLQKIIEAHFQIHKATVGVPVVLGAVCKTYVNIGEVAVCQMLGGNVYRLAGIELVKYFYRLFDVSHRFKKFFGGFCLGTTHLAEPIVATGIFERIVDERA